MGKILTIACMDVIVRVTYIMSSNSSNFLPLVIYAIQYLDSKFKLSVIISTLVSNSTPPETPQIKEMFINTYM